MPSSLNVGVRQRFERVGKLFTVMTGATAQVDGTLRITPKANPGTCTKGDLNVGTDGKLYVCSANNTWTVAGTQA